MDRGHLRLPARDVLLAAALMAGAVVEAGGLSSPQPWTTLVAACWMAPVALRTRAPFMMAVLSGAGAVAFASFPVATTPLSAFVALLVVAFTCGANLSGRSRVVAAVVLVGSVQVVQLVTSARPGGDLAFADVYLAPVVLIGAPLLAGMLLRRSRHQSAELRRLGDELAATRVAETRAAAAAERTQLARELHDVISHSVSVMVVQAGAAEQQLPPDSPAREQLLAVRRTGKEALTELRRQLGLLREGARGSPAPMPGLAELGALAAESDATLDYDTASVGEVPSGLALAVYRVTQEALTNTRRHATGAPVRVRVCRDAEALVLEVVNGPGAGAVDVGGHGHGLVGMRERIGMYDGRLESGRTTDGGWRVCARLPLAGATPPARREGGEGP